MWSTMSMLSTVYTRSTAPVILLHFIDDAPVHNRHHDLHLVDLVRSNFENVLREDHQVGKFTNRDRAFLIFLKLCISRTGGVSTHRLFNRNLLFRYPPLRVLAVQSPSCYGGVNREDWIQRRDGPICSKCQRHAGIEQRTKGVGCLCPLMTDS